MRHSPRSEHPEIRPVASSRLSAFPNSMKSSELMALRMSANISGSYFFHFFVFCARFREPELTQGPAMAEAEERDAKRARTEGDFELISGTEMSAQIRKEVADEVAQVSTIMRLRKGKNVESERFCRARETAQGREGCSSPSSLLCRNQNWLNILLSLA